ncbi:DUF5615 family PIN-like protein [Cecembia lonarensis]|uniref:DUF5615 domain-containing protein n=1 Tax=Cecembia lonarensis (strain CCUG 58316 / KCTC 22772 / LW9) TaxID=1225176 RepID=K1M4A8_CECL9|nr:DUF5615 family PIN-like protein [Cecembia lonarensis]EKB51084.1 hypothetical protein B879_00375 [Cecembia lonarensis LW9]
MARFLIDVNLPYYFSLWNNSEYIHQLDIDDTWTDAQIWEYAKKKKLTIISKDADFYNKILMTNPPPKVIHIKIGNLKIRDFHELISKNWSEVLELNKDNKLVLVYSDRIEGVKS